MTVKEFVVSFNTKLGKYAIANELSDGKIVISTPEGETVAVLPSGFLMARAEASIGSTMINIKMFLELFNAISMDYKAVAFPSGNVAIKDEDGGEVIAELGSQSIGWQFDSCAFNWDEMKLMSDLAGTMPVFRSEPDDIIKQIRHIEQGGREDD